MAKDAHDSQIILIVGVKRRRVVDDALVLSIVPFDCANITEPRIAMNPHLSDPSSVTDMTVSQKTKHDLTGSPLHQIEQILILAMDPWFILYRFQVTLSLLLTKQSAQGT